jgi:hypothetical protein
MATTWKEKLDLLKTFWSGYKTFQKTGVTPREAWVSLRKLYAETNGWFNDIFQFCYAINHPGRPYSSSTGSVLPGYSEKTLRQAVHHLNRDGYYIFPQRLEQKYIDALMKFALETPATLQYDNAKVIPTVQAAELSADGGESKTSDATGYYGLGSVGSEKVCFDPNNILGTNYRLPLDVVIDNPTVQTLMADPAIICTAQHYFKSQASSSTICMWWTTPFGCDKPSSALAQQYHFDMDRIKFLKFFLYLTDVGPGDGPHCFVKSSHIRKPKALQRDGRFQDDEVHPHYDSSRLLEFTAPRGTLIAEDTRGLHKAKMPTEGSRLVLEFEMTSSLFGYSYPRLTIAVKSPQLQAAIKQNPIIWSNYDISEQVASKQEKVLVRN